MRNLFFAPLAFMAYLFASFSAIAEQNCDASCLAARKAANPLADVRAVITDNTVAYETGSDEETSYNFQIQPVYAIPLDGANLVLRGIVPVQGIQPGAAMPPGISNPTSNTTMEWGIGDSTIQTFYSPTSDSNIAYGFGIQASLPTRTERSLKGAGWGAGPAAVMFGQTGNLSWGGVVAHMWAEDGFSTSILQPILNYGLGQGWYFGYNNLVSYNWNAGSDAEAWQIPLGLMAGRTIVTNEEAGTAVDLNVGYYSINRSPIGDPTAS